MSQKASEFLKVYYTDTLDAWNEIDAWHPSGWTEEQAIGVVNLARLTGELSLLPAAIITSRRPPPLFQG